jgi:hypothetical protein
VTTSLGGPVTRAGAGSPSDVVLEHVDERRLARLGAGVGERSTEIVPSEQVALAVDLLEQAARRRQA